ncbi:MAG: dihydropteroate synthase, partial [Rhodospirillales bacterium]|nr:dihydropteroate synthase [Rhodospirillales bacterium]
MYGAQRPSRPCPASFAGLSLARPVIMGIVNVTPDSFSDPGETEDAATAIGRGRAMIEAGAEIIDIGGASTRPGADPVTPELEAARVLPVIRGLAGPARQAGARLSVDTSRGALMAAALEAGAAILNDITGLEGDPTSLGIASGGGASVILMHMQGTPKTMNLAPTYNDLIGEVVEYLAGRVRICEKAGIPLERLAVDPGIGFGKTDAQNRELLKHLDRFAGFGCALLVG